MHLTAAESPRCWNAPSLLGIPPCIIGLFTPHCFLLFFFNFFLKDLTRICRDQYSLGLLKRLQTWFISSLPISDYFRSQVFKAVRAVSHRRPEFKVPWDGHLVIQKLHKLSQLGKRTLLQQESRIKTLLLEAWPSNFEPTDKASWSACRGSAPLLQPSPWLQNHLLQRTLEDNPRGRQ